jgi:hypothetical protein
MCGFNYFSELLIEEIGWIGSSTSSPHSSRETIGGYWEIFTLPLVFLLYSIGFPVFLQLTIGVCFPTVIYSVFIHYNTLWNNSNAFSLILCKVYTKRENAGRWNSGPDKAMLEIPILHISK